MGRKNRQPEVAVSGGNLGEAIREALKKKQQNPGPQKDSPKKGLKDRLAALLKNRASAVDVRQVFQEADDIVADPQYIRGFAATVRDADEIGVHKLAATKPWAEACEKWFALSWDEQEAELREWAKAGDTLAASVVEGLEQFNQNVPLRDELREAVDRFERPCRGIENLVQLKRFLDGLVEEGLVHRINGPSYIPEDGIVNTIESGKLLYAPKKVIRTARIGWLFVKEAETEAGVNQEGLDALQAKAFPGLTPFQVSKGVEGNLFLFLGSSQAVLLECKLEGDRMTAKVVETVGLPDLLPSEPILWEKRYERNKWPDARIPKSLKHWEEKLATWKQEQVADRDRARDELKPLVSLATLPYRFEEQGLTRLLKGEKGVVACWHRNFEWSNRSGLFGIALERTDEGFFLREVISPVHPFDRELLNEKLPLVVDSEKPSVRLEQLPKIEQGRFLSLKMVEKLLVLRRGAEERTISGEPVPENGQNNGQ